MTERLEEIETLSDGRRLLVRPIRSSDAPLERAFIENLSPQSRRFRFLASIKTPSEALLKQLTELDDSKEVAFIAVTLDLANSCQVAAARFSAQPDRTAEIAVVVDDRWQRKGLATVLLTRLIKAARDRGITRLYSMDAASNHAMRDLAAHLGFTCHPDPKDITQVIYSRDL